MQDRTVCSSLMDRAARGDGDAFASLALEVQDCLHRFGLAHSLSDADAAEATQETLLRAYRVRKNWRPGGDALGWLYGVTMNVVREMRRKSRRRGFEAVELTTLAANDCDRPGGVGRGYGDGEVSAGLDMDVRQEALRAALTALPPRQQEAVSCRYLLEMSLQETAEAMGCAEGTVKAAVFAALENLRKIMKDQRE